MDHYHNRSKISKNNLDGQLEKFDAQKKIHELSLCEKQIEGEKFSAFYQQHLPSFSTVHKSNCDICHFPEQKNLLFPVRETRTNKPFELIHVNLCGPPSITSICNHKYFFTIIDD